MMLLQHKAMMTRTRQAFENMEKRFGPKIWKSGKRMGQLKDPGRELPFTLEEFREWVCTAVANGVRCHYCPTFIDMRTFVVDHSMPVTRGGSLGLENLQCICADCNSQKSDLNDPEYVALNRALHLLGPVIEKSVRKRLRTAGMAGRLRWFPGNKKPPAAPAPTYDDPNF